MPIGLPGFSPNLIQQQQRIAALPSDPQERALAQRLIQLTQQNKVGTPEYFMTAGEFQNRQKIRQQQQATQQKPPPVVAELTAQAAQKAAPATSGVAQLPVGGIGQIGNYAGAGGGIVAFESGGQVPRFQNRGAVGDPYQYRAFSSPFTMTEEERKEQERLRQLGFIDALRYAGERLNPFTGGSLQERVSGQPLRKPETTTPAQVAQMAPVTTSISDVNKMIPGEMALRSAPALREPYIPEYLKEAAPAAAGLPSIASMYKEAQREAGVPSEGARQKTAQELVDERKEFMKAAGYDEQFFEKQRADIEKQKGETKTDKQDAMNMRLIEAGLGILGGESPYAFVNIGKGASPALKGLQEDFKDIRKLTRDYDKAIRDINVAEQTSNRELGLSALQRRDSLADKIEERKYDMAKTLFSGRVQMAIAQQPGAQERLIDRAMRDPKFSSVAEKFIGRSGSGEAAQRARAFDTWSKDPGLRDQYPEFEDYYRLKGGSSGFTFLGKE